MTNLEEIREEWPYIDWEGTLGRNWKASILGDTVVELAVKSVALGNKTSGSIGRYLPRFVRATMV